MYCARCGSPMTPGAAACPACGEAAPALPALTLRRPGIVTLLAVLQLLGATLYLGFAALMVFLAFVAPSEDDVPPAGIVAVILGVLFGGFGLLHLACGVGLLKLRGYGRTIQIVLAVIGLLGLPVGTIISILILVYMFKPGVKLLFSGRDPRQFTPQERADAAAAMKGGAAAVLIVVVVVLMMLAVGLIIAAIAVPNFLNAVQRGKTKRTLADMQAIATAVEAHAVDHQASPAADDVEELASLLEPTYVRDMPRLDGWGHPFRYAAGSELEYVLASGGRDGQWEEDDPWSYEPDETSEFDADIVLRNGQWVRVPSDAVESGGALSPSDDDDLDLGEAWEESDEAGEEEAPEDVAPEATDGSGQPEGGGVTPAPEGLALTLNDWRLRADGGRIVAEGSVTNMTSSPIEGGIVTVVFVNEAGEDLLTAEEALPSLRPGHPTIWTVGIPPNPAVLTARVSFAAGDGTPLEFEDLTAPVP